MLLVSELSGDIKKASFLLKIKALWNQNKLYS